MINVKDEMQYVLVIRLLEKAAAAELLTPTELHTAKRLAREKYQPKTVWE